MKSRLLLHNNEYVSNANVLEWTDDLEELVENVGYDMSNWPQDLGIYENHGLFVWEGEYTAEGKIPEGKTDPVEEDTFTGGLRRLNREELLRLAKGDRVIS